MSLMRSLRNIHISNAAYGIADYVTLPALMLCSAPFLLHHLGVDQYAIWVLSSAAVTSGLMLSAGFGDAALKYIAAYRGKNDSAGVQRIIRNMIGINLSLGTIIALLLAAFIPFLVVHLPNLNSTLRICYSRSLTIGCILLVVKAVESVFICAQRAYERYDIAARFTIATRIVTICATVVIVGFGGGAVTIMLATLIAAVISVILQALAIKAHIHELRLWPQLDHATVKELFSFGAFSWLQGLIGLLTSQADRFLVAYLLGTQTVAVYSICVQAAMPIHGIAAAGLQVLFPYLASRLGYLSRSAIRQTFRYTFTANVVIVSVLAAPFLFASHFILRLWMGTPFADRASTVLTLTACGYALLGLNVTGYFTLMAIGRIKLLAVFNIIGAVIMLSAIALLAPRFGVAGAAAGRLIYGPILCLIYIPLHRFLGTTSTVAYESKALLEAQ